jgi:hypothetical protein
MNSSIPHTPASIRDPIDASVNMIYEAARDGNLVMCAGAGLSRAAPSELPSGPKLGVDLDARLAGIIAGYKSPSSTDDLISVADAGEEIAGGEPALRGEVLRLADFTGADPNFGHKATAELLCEGGISLLLLWNWDNCIERVDVSPERLQVSRAKSDLEDLKQPSIAKIHGCATRRESLLITSQDLDEPPVWTDEATLKQLREKTVVFVGVGDIADYARRRLEQLRNQLRENPPLDIWVVSPGIEANWEKSAWAELFPDLSSDRRIAMSADDFLDQLSRRWARDVLDGLESATAEAQDGTKDAIGKLCEQLNAWGAVRLLRWTRGSGLGQKIGVSVALNSALTQLLVGYAVLAREQKIKQVVVRAPSAVQLDQSRVEGLVACGSRTAQQVRARAHERAQMLADQGLIGDSASFLVAGSVVGTLNDDPEMQLDIAVGDQHVDDLVTGPSAVRLSFNRAADLEAIA